jgi:hypothetical protein
MSPYTKAKNLFDSSLKNLNKHIKKEEWAIKLCEGLSELAEGMKETDQVVRSIAQMADTIRNTQMSQWK